MKQILCFACCHTTIDEKDVDTVVISKTKIAAKHNQIPTSLLSAYIFLGQRILIEHRQLEILDFFFFNFTVKRMKGIGIH